VGPMGVIAVEGRLIGRAHERVWSRELVLGPETRSTSRVIGVQHAHHRLSGRASCFNERKHVAAKVEVSSTVTFLGSARVNGERVDDTTEGFQNLVWLDKQDRHVPVTSSFRASYPRYSLFRCVGSCVNELLVEKCY